MKAAAVIRAPRIYLVIVIVQRLRSQRGERAAIHAPLTHVLFRGSLALMDRTKFCNIRQHLRRPK